MIPRAPSGLQQCIPELTCTEQTEAGSQVQGQSLIFLSGKTKKEKIGLLDIFWIVFYSKLVFSRALLLWGKAKWCSDFATVAPTTFPLCCGWLFLIAAFVISVVFNLLIVLGLVCSHYFGPLPVPKHARPNSEPSVRCRWNWTTMCQPL